MLRFDKNQKYCIFDYETTNLNLCFASSPTPAPFIQYPWQLGWRVDTLKENILEREDWIWWEDLKMGEDAARVTRFDYDVYKQKAKPPKPILDEFEKYLLDPKVISVTANGWNFDQYLFNIYRRKLNRKSDWSFVNRLVDIQTLEKAKVLGASIPQIGTDEWVFFNIRLSQYHKKGLKTNLAHLCREYGVEYREELHHVSSNYDVFLTFQIFLKQIQIMDIFISPS